jgi:hypothetical protein
MFVLIARSIELPDNQTLINEHNVNPNSLYEVAVFLFTTHLCPIGIWFIIAVPLGIAAIATYGRTKNS